MSIRQIVSKSRALLQTCRAVCVSVPWGHVRGGGLYKSTGRVWGVGGSKYVQNTKVFWYFCTQNGWVPIFIENHKSILVLLYTNLGGFGRKIGTFGENLGKIFEIFQKKFPKNVQNFFKFFPKFFKKFSNFFKKFSEIFRNFFKKC